MYILAIVIAANLSTRYDSHSGGEREIQRTMLELLNQLDGFDSKGDVKVSTLHTYMYLFCSQSSYVQI